MKKLIKRIWFEERKRGLRKRIFQEVREIQ